MDESNELRLSKDLSSYSSFFKTQTSIDGVVNNAKEPNDVIDQHKAIKIENDGGHSADVDRSHSPVVKAEETDKDTYSGTIKYSPKLENGHSEQGTAFNHPKEQPVTPVPDNGEKNTHTGNRDDADILGTELNTERGDNENLLDSNESATKSDRKPPVHSPQIIDHSSTNETKQQEEHALGTDTETETVSHETNGIDKTQEHAVGNEISKEHSLDQVNSDAVEHKPYAETVTETVVNSRNKGITAARNDRMETNHRSNRETPNDSETVDQGITQDSAPISPNREENNGESTVISQYDQYNNHEKAESDEEQMPTFEANETDFIKGVSTARDSDVEREKPDRIENRSPTDKDNSDSKGNKDTDKDNEELENVEEKNNENNEQSVDVVKKTTGEIKERRNSASPAETHDHGTMVQHGKDTALETQSKQTDVESSEEKHESSNDGNLYFTGRLPTLITMNEKSMSTPINEVDAESSAEGDLEDPNDDRNPTDKAYEDKQEDQRVPTASKKVKELLNKINEPIEPRGRYSRGNQLTPRTMLKKAKSATSTRTAKTEVIDEIEEVAKENGSTTASMTVDDINVYTSKIMHANNADDQTSKFDNLAHMQNISLYVHESRLKNLEHRDQTTDDHQDNGAATNKPTDLLNSSQNKTLPVYPNTVNEMHKNNTTKENHTATLENDIKLDTNNNRSEHSHPCTPRSTSESDLKAIIASAKMARGETTEEADANDHDTTYSEIANLSLVGGIKPVSKKTRAFAERNNALEPHDHINDNDETMTSLICSRCLKVDRNIHKSGFCTVCQTYLCSTCIDVHMMDIDTQTHEISPSYCKNELKHNKYVPATGYCSDCNTFLCMKCTVQHTQLRANRRHRVIQSSFVSKPSQKHQYTDNFLDELQGKLNGDMSESSSSLDGTERKRRKMLADVKDTNPHRYRFGYVPESIYPGSKKKQTTSYTKQPKWPHSSLPALPYLVQPKFIKERFYYPKHVGFHSRKKEISYMSTRLKALQSRYNLRPEYEKLYSRKDRSQFISKTGYANESISLPDIDRHRSVRQINEESKATHGPRICDFIATHHLSLPVETGEHSTEIIGMTILLNGNLAVIDKNNNNIKIYNKLFNCKAALQFHNRLVDLCTSNICPTDLYAATPKHIYEISNEDGLNLRRKMKVEIKRIEGLTYWKYGLAIISKKSNITWELRLMDYRGNQKSKLEIFNPLTCEIASSQLCHVTTSNGGKRISISDSKNFCVITVDVTSRDVQHETSLGAGNEPTYLTADGDTCHNIYVSANSKVYQISKKGKVKGVVLDRTKENETVGSIVCNKASDRLYVQTGRDTLCVYQLI